jgi:hypothetical protein
MMGLPNPRELVLTGGALLGMLLSEELEDSAAAEDRVVGRRWTLAMVATRARLFLAEKPSKVSCSHKSLMRRI